jgi:hypothetical protein
MRQSCANAGHPRIVLLAIGALVLAGCGDSAPYDLAPVSGTVTLDGKPIPYTQIIFVPKGSADNPNPGPSSLAFCDDSGKFMLKTDRGDPGAVVGIHTVQIYAHGPPRSTAGDTDVGPPPKEMFPERFNVNTELTFEVLTGGTSAADFKLTTNP